jgi:hypothetical protein
MRKLVSKALTNLMAHFTFLILKTSHQPVHLPGLVEVESK